MIPMLAVETRTTIGDIFAGCNANGYLHARSLQSDLDLGFQADETVATASVFKIAVASAVAHLMTTGELDPATTLRIDPSDHCAGGGVINGFQYPAQLTIADLFHLMMVISDNTATDVLMGYMDAEAVNRHLRNIGCKSTHIMGDCRETLTSYARSFGFESLDDAEVQEWQSPKTDLVDFPVESSTNSTARDTTQLLAELWRDDGPSAEASRWVRNAMSRQLWPHRLRAAFPESVAIAGKTGTLPPWRNEAGVVKLEDDRQFAVAVFTRADSIEGVQPAIDAAIGQAARVAIDHLAAAEAAG